MSEQLNGNKLNDSTPVDKPYGRVPFNLRRIGCMVPIAGFALAAALAWELGVRARVVINDHDINGAIYNGNSGLLIGVTKVDKSEWRPVLVSVPPEN